MADKCGCGCGHDHDHDHEEEFEVQLVTLIDEEGNEQEFEVIEIFEVDGTEYVAIALPEEEAEADDDEVMVFRLEVDEKTGEEILHDIEDDDEWNKVAEAYMDLGDEEE